MTLLGEAYEGDLNGEIKSENYDWSFKRESKAVGGLARITSPFLLEGGPYNLMINTPTGLTASMEIMGTSDSESSDICLGRLGNVYRTSLMAQSGSVRHRRLELWQDEVHDTVFGTDETITYHPKIKVHQNIDAIYLIISDPWEDSIEHRK